MTLTNPLIYFRQVFDKRKLSEVSNIATQLDSLINSLSDDKHNLGVGSPAKSESSINNSAVEELPEEVLSTSVGNNQKPSLVSPIISQQHFLNETLDKDTGNIFNLSKISERTEVSDSWKHSDKSASITSDAFYNSVVSSTPQLKAFNGSVAQNKGRRPRSVLSFLFGCFFPICRLSR